MSDDTTVSRESHIYCQVSSHLHIYIYIITSSRKNGKPFYTPMDADPEQNLMFFFLISLLLCQVLFSSFGVLVFRVVFLGGFL